jgi:hypothetical protein
MKDTPNEGEKSDDEPNEGEKSDDEAQDRNP